LTEAGEARFDEVIFACHADQALAMIEAPSEAEQKILGAVTFQDNEAVLHQDSSLMPRRKLAWSSWNYLSQGKQDHEQAVCLTYWMNLLQGMQTRLPLQVSLNPNIAIEPPNLPASAIRRGGDRGAGSAAGDSGGREIMVRRRLDRLGLS
jgi:predicted NAD/FAD-binding protein